MTDPTSTTAKAKRSKGNIKPSTQDPIQRWLDIFIPMTGLPKARQADIRAELEDHLRARTGDLMITGLSEPEAVQQAVNELGETAHLAKQFRTALKPKRISPMHTALIAIAGSALTLGVFSTINNPAALPAQATTAAALASSENAEADTLANAVPATDYAFAKGGTIDLRTATLTTIFDQVRTNLDRPLVIHWEHLDQIGIPKDQPIGLDADPLPTEVALRLAIQRAETEDFGGIAIVNNPDAVEITTTEYLDHRTKQIKPHDIADLIAHYETPEQRFTSPVTPAKAVRTRQTAEQAGNEILQTIMPLVSRDAWTDFGGDLATASVVGSSLIIDAPARIHAEVEDIIEMMQTEVDRFIESKKAAAAETESEKAAKIDRLSAARDALRASISALSAEEQRLDLEQSKALQNSSGAAMAIRHFKMSNPEEIRRNNPHNAYYQLPPEELADIETEAGEHAVALEAQITDIQLRLQDLRNERELISNDLVQLGYRPAIQARNARLQRAREEPKAEVRPRGVSQNDLRDANGNLDIEKVNKAFGGHATLSRDRRDRTDQN